jgi:hypothetical protein
MRKIPKYLALGVSLGVVFASSVAGEAKAAPLYRVVISVTDNTSGGTGGFQITDNLSNDSNTAANQIQQSSQQTPGGILVQGIASAATSSPNSATLTIGGELTVTDSSTDTYTITIQTFYSGYTNPLSGTTNTLTQSESGTFTGTPAGGSQTFQSWFNNGTTGAFPSGGVTPGMQTIPMPDTFDPNPSSASVSQNSPYSVTVPSYTPPFTLSNQIVVTLVGNGTSTNSDVKFSASTTLTAVTVPEPTSIAMFLTGMPMPLLILGLLRRRKAAAAKG